jgi:hypothetical protein
MALELCKKTLANNLSSAKAWEHQGLIMMKTEGKHSRTAPPSTPSQSQSPSPSTHSCNLDAFFVPLIVV